MIGTDRPTSTRKYFVIFARGQISLKIRKYATNITVKGWVDVLLNESHGYGVSHLHWPRSVEPWQ